MTRQAGRPDPGEKAGDGEEEGDGEAGGADQPKKKRRLKKSATVEKNLKNINVNKFELEFDVDPLFKKTSSQFDSGSGGNQGARWPGSGRIRGTTDTRSAAVLPAAHTVNP